MIKLGKLKNGVALFNLEEKTMIVFQKDDNKNVFICFDTSEYDKTNEPWIVKDFDILRKDNEEICQLLDKLYLAYLARLKTYPSKFVYTNKEHQIIYYARTVGNNTELAYPSEELPIDKATWFGIIKYQDHAYSLTFHKSNDQRYRNIQSVCIKYTEPKIYELYPIYEEFIKSLCNMTTEDFTKVNKEFMTCVSDGLTAKQLKLTK